MNTYRQSNGERITKAALDRKVRDAKERVIQNQLNEHGYNFCHKCVNSGLPGSASDMEMRTLDCAHLESVDSCQKNWRAEKAWDPKNIMILCRHHHREHDKTNLKFKTNAI